MGLKEAMLGALILEYIDDDECERDCDCEDGYSCINGECKEDDDEQTLSSAYVDEDDEWNSFDTSDIDTVEMNGQYTEWYNPSDGKPYSGPENW